MKLIEPFTFSILRGGASEQPVEHDAINRNLNKPRIYNIDTNRVDTNRQSMYTTQGTEHVYSSKACAGLASTVTDFASCGVDSIPHRVMSPAVMYVPRNAHAGNTISN